MAIFQSGICLGEDHLQGPRAGKKIGQIVFRGTRLQSVDYLFWSSELNNRVWREANFLKVRWQVYEAGEESCQGR